MLGGWGCLGRTSPVGRGRAIFGGKAAGIQGHTCGSPFSHDSCSHCCASRLPAVGPCHGTTSRCHRRRHRCWLSSLHRPPLSRRRSPSRHHQLVPLPPPLPRALHSGTRRWGGRKRWGRPNPPCERPSGRINRYILAYSPHENITGCWMCRFHYIAGGGRKCGVRTELARGP